MLPHIHTIEEPSWKEIEPFAAHLLRLGDVENNAALYLRSRYLQEQFGDDTINNTTDSYFVQDKDSILKIFDDNSALLGHMKDINTVSWYGIPFLVTTHVFPATDEDSLGKNGLRITVKDSALILQGNGLLQSAWKYCLQQTMQAWVQQLGPVPEYGAPYSGHIVSPCYPFYTLRQRHQEALYTFLHEAVVSTGLKGEGISLAVWGHQATPTRWTDLYVEILENDHSEDDATKKYAIRFVTDLLNHPDFPFPKAALIQELADQNTLVMIDPGLPSNHRVMEAKAFMAGYSFVTV